MQPDVSIQSIEFRTHCFGCHGLSSVRVNLSNGESSPIYQNFDASHDDLKTINFDPFKIIRSVEANNNEWDGDKYLTRIRFMDITGEEVYVYNQ